MILYSEAKVSPVGKVNEKDLKKVAMDTLIFFAAPLLIYLAQVQGTLTQNHIVILKDFIPSLMTIGAIEGWAIGIVINFLLKLRDGRE